MAEPGVVVIGAGLGGLSAAVALARRGVAVTLLEKEPRPGGYAVAYRRGGHTFDLALHVTAAGGPGQEFHDVCADLGLGVRFLRLADGFHVRLGDFAFRMPNQEETLFAELARAFPAESGGLGRLRRDLAGHAAVYGRLFDRRVSRWRSLPPFLPRLPLFLRHAVLPARDYLARFIGDPRLAAILYQPAVFMGIPADSLAALNFMMMFRLLVGDGMYTIAGGGQALTDALERRFIELGGRIVARAEVKRIVVAGGRARGVRTADGTEYPAGAVVAAINLPRTVRELVGEEHFPAGYLRNLSTLRPSLSVLALNLGLDRPPRELGIAGHITTVFPDADLDGCLRRQAGDGYSVTAPDNSEPQAPGRWTLSLVTGADPEKWLSLEPEAYLRAKEETSARLMASLEKAFPGTTAHVAVSDLATPRTMQRYTGNPGGALMGFADTRGEHRRIMAAGRLPLGGLHVAGAWSPYLGGFLQCVKSGVAAAELVARELR